MIMIINIITSSESNLDFWLFGICFCGFRNSKLATNKIVAVLHCCCFEVKYLPVNTVYKFIKLPMTGFEPQTSGSEATALPTEPPPLP